MIGEQSRALEDLGRTCTDPARTLSPDSVVMLEAVLSDLADARTYPRVANRRQHLLKLQLVEAAIRLLFNEVDPRAAAS